MALAVMAITAGIAMFLVAATRSLISSTTAACDPARENLLDFRQWQEETDPNAILTDENGVKKSDAFWWGNYTLLDGNGNALTSGNWPYLYDHYWGFIRMKVVGNKLFQRNIFVYPPATAEMCTANNNSVGSGLVGVCGTNGAEKVFEAEQSAVDCSGNLAGPFGTGMQLSDTFTTLTGNGSAILYQVKTPDYAAIGLPNFAALSNKLLQSQLTTLPGDGTRVRTAQGFSPFAPSFGASSYSSYYREHRLADEREFMAKLAAVRAEANVLASDMCKHDGGGGGELEQPDCWKHLLLDDDFDSQITCAEINGGDPDSRCA